MDEIHESNSSNNSQNSKKRKVDTLPLALVSSNESDESNEENSISKMWLYFKKDKIKQVERCKDQQPLSVIANNGFIELIREAVSNYKLPSNKAIKILLSQAFMHTKQQLMNKLSETLFYGSLTTNL
ncbi:3245_t:CDS:2 [Cetraspora pellucida]|uniref:3245_t:CDS:1 n=1 Tax=Cetraspora pellucida TaxID=1433469 RepID=A0ACA9Q466_9GLOM|nr:3245_t:CDS:2 [Cetraspora pellucida]